MGKIPKNRGIKMKIKRGVKEDTCTLARIGTVGYESYREEESKYV